MSVASVEISANIRRYVEEMKKLPGVTEKEAYAAGKKLQQQMEAAETRAARSAKVAEQAAAKAAMSVSDKLQVVAKTSSVLNGALGDVTGPLGDFGDLMEMVDARTAAIAVGATAGAAAVVALGAALAAGVGHAVDVVRAWDDYVAASGGATDRTIELSERVADARLSLEDLDHSIAAVSLELGASLAPQIEASADAMAGIVAVVGDAVGAIGDYNTATTDSAVATAEHVMQLGVLGANFPMVTAAYIAGTEALSRLIAYGDDRAEQLRAEQAETSYAAAQAERLAAAYRDESEQLAKLLGLPAQTPEAQDPEAKRAAEEARRERERAAAEAQRSSEAAAAAARRVVEEQVRAGEQLMAISARQVQDLMGEYDRIYAKRDELIAQILDLGIVSGNYAEAERAIGQAQELAARQAMEARDAEAAAFQRSIEAGQRLTLDLGAMLETTADRAKAANQAVGEAAQAAAAESADRALSTASAVAGNIQALVQGVIALFDTQTKHGKEAARQAFQISKIAAIADITVKTAQAVMAAAATGPGGAVLIPLAVATGAIQAAIVAGAQPQFHGGRVLAADETSAVLQRHEVVIPAPEVSRQGGPQGVADRLRGKASDGVTILRADFSDRSVLVPLARETRTAGGVPSLYGWASG